MTPTDFEGIPWSRIALFSLFLVAIVTVGGFIKTGNIIVSLVAGVVTASVGFGLIAFKAWRAQKPRHDLE